MQIFFLQIVRRRKHVFYNLTFVNRYFDRYIRQLTDHLIKASEKRFEMFDNKVLFVFIVVCWLYSIGESGVVTPRKLLQAHITGGSQRMFALYIFIDTKISCIL